MKKKLYYTVDPQLEDINGTFETNGNQDITIYEIVDNVPNKLFSIFCPIAGKDEEKIFDSKEYYEHFYDKEEDEVDFNVELIIL